MTRSQAELLARNDKAYRARLMRGEWIVWDDVSDSQVTFDRIPETIDSEVTFTLTLSQFNELQCNLTDARAFNEEHGYPALAEAAARFKDMLYNQVPRKRIDDAIALLPVTEPVA